MKPHGRSGEARSIGRFLGALDLALLPWVSYSLTASPILQAPLSLLGLKLGNKQPLPILKHMNGILRPVGHHLSPADTSTAAPLLYRRDGGISVSLMHCQAVGRY